MVEDLINIKLNKKFLIITLIFILLIGGIGIVISLNSGNPSIHGHIASEIKNIATKTWVADNFLYK